MVDSDASQPATTVSPGKLASAWQAYADDLMKTVTTGRYYGLLSPAEKQNYKATEAAARAYRACASQLLETLREPERVPDPGNADSVRPGGGTQPPA